jgi:hypothetical protein
VRKLAGAGVENGTKNNLDGWSLWSREKHKFPAGEQGILSPRGSSGA